MQDISSNLFIIACFIFCLFQTVSNYSMNGFQIRDLEHTGANFQAEANTWSVSGLEPGANKWYNCAGTYLLGGLGVLQTACGLYTGSFGPCNQWGQWFSKTYTSLPPHSSVYFSLTFWAMSAWDLGDYFNIYFGGLSFSIWTMSVSSFPDSICGGYSGVKNIRIYGIVSHSASTLTVTFTSRMDEPSSNEAWGIRDLQLLFSTTANSNYKCASPSWIPYLPGSWPPCSCSGWGETAASCASCASGCTSCFGSGASQCYACASGYMWDGNQCVLCHSSCSVCYGPSNNQCKACQSGYYLWEGNTCIASALCASPLTQTPSTSANVQVPALAQTICSFPCSSGSFLGWNNVCQTSCPTPFVSTTKSTTQGSILACDNPCATSGGYLYGDSSCQSTCPSHFTVTSIGGQNLCKTPCNTAPNIIVYGDGSCTSSCDPPFTQATEHGNLLCKSPCTTSSYYLYDDGNCESTCPLYFTATTIGGQNLCKTPCNTVPNIIVYDDGSCTSTCDPPFNQVTQHGNKICKSSCTTSTDYLYSDGFCLSTCPAHFLVTAVGGQNLCKTPCNTAPNIIVYEDGSCTSSCDPPFTQTTEHGNLLCKSPCTTSSSYLYDDGNCESTCPPSLTVTSIGGQNLCKTPCNTIPNTIVYPDGTCTSICDPPFNQVTEHGNKLCKSPCTTSSDYLSSDGNCESTCPPYFTATTIGGQNLCKTPCNTAPNIIVYEDGSCTSTCDPPFNQVIEHGNKLCKSPCTTPSDYLYDDGSCLSTCSAYFLVLAIGGQNLCSFPCPNGYALLKDGTCQPPQAADPPQAIPETVKTTLKSSQITNSATTKAASAINSGRVMSISAAIGGRIFFNIKFMNVSYSLELQEALKSWKSGFISLSLTPDLPQGTLDKIPQRSVPPTFEKYEVDASFFVNFWQDLGILLMTATVCLLLRLCGFFFVSEIKPGAYFQKLLRELKTRANNFLLSSLYSIYGDLVLFAILEYRSFQLDFDLSLFSFLISVALITIMLICLYFHYRLLERYQKLKNQPELLKAFEKDHENIEILYKGFKEESFSTQSFLIILTLREVLFSIFLSTLFNHPIIQVALSTCNNIFMLIYLMDKRPFKSRFDLYQQIFFELIGLIVNIGVLMNTLLPLDDHTFETRPAINIGRMIIVMNLIFNFSSAGLMIFQILCTIKEYWDVYRSKKEKKIVPLPLDSQGSLQSESNNVTIQDKSARLHSESSAFDTSRNESNLLVKKNQAMGL